jgi:hypothetical protein
MKFSDRLKMAFGRHVDVGGESIIIPKMGRSSVENVTNFAGTLDYFNNHYDIIDRNLVKGDLLQTIARICVANPDVSQAVKQWINLGNQGHDVIIQDDNEALVDAAIEALNDNAYRLYQKSAGVDGLFNHYLWQLGVFGAISSEDVIAGDMSRVEKVAPISPRFIRFKLEDDEYKPYQQVHSATNNLIPLNDYTYTYYCYLSFENSPYGIPPAIAALDGLHTQKFMHENIKYIAEKLGLTGVTDIEVMIPPRKPQEMDIEYNKRVEAYLGNLLEAFEANYRKGLMLHASDVKINHTNTTGDARGAYDIHKLNEEQVFSGINNDPAMHGRSYSTTETYADVVYNLLVNQTNSFRRLVKRRHEKTMRLDLALRGILVQDIALQMNGNDQRDSEKAANTEQIKWNTIKEKVQQGAIDPDQAAQELGYDEWFDASKISGGQQPTPLSELKKRSLILSRLNKKDQKKHKIRFNQKSQQYQFVRPRHEVSLAKKSKTPKEFIEEYFNAIWPAAQSGKDEAVDAVVEYLGKRSFDPANIDNLAAETFAIIKETFKEAMKSDAVQAAVKDAINPIYSFFRLSDKSVWPDNNAPLEMVMDTVDNRSIKFLQAKDDFYLGKFIENTDVEGPVVKFIKKQYLENGEGLFGRTSAKNIDAFRDLFKNKLEDMADHAIQRILDTSVQQMRNWGHIGQLYEAEIEYARPVNPSPEAAICIYVTSNNILIPVGTARNAINRLAGMSAEEYRSFLEANGQTTPEKIKSFGIDAATAEGIGFPPYHPHCHTVLEAVL